VFAKKFIEIHPQQPGARPEFLVVKRGWSNKMDHYGEVCDKMGDRDPWTQETYYRTAVDAKPAGWFKKTCDEPFQKQGDDCTCPYTQAKGFYTGCLVNFPVEANSEKKEMCIEHKSWRKLFDKWLKISRFPLPLQAVVAPSLTSSDFFSNKCKVRATVGSCKMFRSCPAEANSVCNAADNCECNDGRCLLDYNDLIDHKCLNYEDWVAEGTTLANIPYAIDTYGHHLNHVDQDGSWSVEMPEFPSFAVGVPCERKIDGSSCGMFRCDNSRHAFCSSGVCMCNIDKCAWEGRCVSFQTWLAVVKKWATISDR